MARRTRADGVEPPSTVLLPRALMTGVTPSCSYTLAAGGADVDIRLLYSGPGASLNLYYAARVERLLGGGQHFNHARPEVHVAWMTGTWLRSQVDECVERNPVRDNGVEGARGRRFTATLAVHVDRGRRRGGWDGQAERGGARTTVFVLQNKMHLVSNAGACDDGRDLAERRQQQRQRVRSDVPQRALL